MSAQATSAAQAALATAHAQNAVKTSPDKAANEPQSSQSRNNLIKRTVDEICALMAEVHEIREELLAHGVNFHMLNALIELGVSNKPSEQAKTVTTAVEASVKAHGSQAIKRDELEKHLESIVTLEKELRHAQRVAAQQGVHMQALRHLTQLIRLNPGDGGVQAINTFVAYADAADIPLDRVRKILSQFADGPDSVLPQIEREDQSNAHDGLREFAKNILIGLVVTAIVMWMVL